MKRWMMAALLALAASGAQARTVELAISDMDRDDLDCGLRYPEIKTRAQAALQKASVREVSQSDYSLALIITSVKRESYCASDIIVSLRRQMPLADSDIFRTRSRSANLELCREGGLVASPIDKHAGYFLEQLDRSVRNCFAQLSY